MNRRSFVAGLLSMLLAPFARAANKKVTRILVVFAPDELQAEQHAGSMLDRWQDVGGRRFWPEKITRIEKVAGHMLEYADGFGHKRPARDTWFRYTIEGIDGGEAEVKLEISSYWDFP